MKHYILTSQSFDGQVEFRYSDSGRLSLFKDDSKMSSEQYDWLILHLPSNEDQLTVIKSKIKGKLEEVPPDLSFETAYNLYGFKRNAFRARKIWEKMTDGDKMNCIRSFKSYLRYIGRKTISQMIFDRYLAERQWETDWDALK